MLTKKQRELLVLIHERMQKDDVAPSFDEMKTLLGLKSKSGIHRLITGLVERGYLERLPYRARALAVKKLPSGYGDHDIPARGGDASAHRSVPAAVIRSAKQISDTLLSIPLYGRIAAGTAIEAIRHDGQTIDIPPGMIGLGDHYALTVSGDSMINAGIHDGDTAIIKRNERPADGRIVVALIDSQEVTLKRLYRKSRDIVLRAENPGYQDIIVPASRVVIQGEMAALLRRYQ